jgi:hypothetical protein
MKFAALLLSGIGIGLAFSAFPCPAQDSSPLEKSVTIDPGRPSLSHLDEAFPDLSRQSGVGIVAQRYQKVCRSEENPAPRFHRDRSWTG